MLSGVEWDSVAAWGLAGAREREGGAHSPADGAHEAGRVVGLAQRRHHLTLNELLTAAAPRAVQPLVVLGADVLTLPHEEATLCQVTAARCGKAVRTCVRRVPWCLCVPRAWTHPSPAPPAAACWAQTRWASVLWDQAREQTPAPAAGLGGVDFSLESFRKGTVIRGEERTVLRGSPVSMLTRVPLWPPDPLGMRP